VSKHRLRFLISLLLEIPILVLIWIIPYTYPHFLTWHRTNGVSLYVYLIGGFATIIQFYLGAKFYLNSYKSLKHKAANMDVLVALGTTSAYLYGVVRIAVGYSEDEIEADMHMYQM
jgi:Cu+-exporting ATPase